MKIKTISAFLVSVISFLFFSKSVWAWGAGIHIAQGEFILNNLNVVLPFIRELLQSYPLDFLYGVISADIFIGKGSRRRDDHCHNWSIGRNMLLAAQTQFEKAFTYGYLSHLAADTVAHNIYIPRQLYRTSTTRKFGHLYWEYRSDIYTEKKHWKIAKKVIVSHDPRDDDFITQTVTHRLLPFKTKKLIFSTTLHLYDLEQWRNAINVVSHNSRWEISREYIESLKKLSFFLALDFLKNPGRAICCKYDPVGSYNIQEAKRRRRLVKKLIGKTPAYGGFEIPEDMLDAFQKIATLTH
ncbi:MAG TPA: zinc dependent phospholipase C family protein [Thermodesulfobacteriota bacterium]|nr:zinc dependent phospholipase C family protein [Thermodesulfobacteriota bacterium]